MKLNRKFPPQYALPLSFDFPLLPVKNVKLNGNSLDLYYLQDNCLEVIDIVFFFDAGSIYESKPLVSSVANKLIKSGTKNKSAKIIAQDFENYGAFISTSSTVHYGTLSVKMLYKNVDIILPLISEIFTESIYPQQELDIYVVRVVEDLNLKLKKSDFLADIKINELLFGANHPYGKIVTIDDYKNIVQSDLLQFYEKFYKNGRCKIFVAGKIKDSLFTLFESYFGSLNLNKQNITFLYPKVEITQNLDNLIESNEKYLQSALRVATLVEGSDSADFLKLKFLNVVLGGYFGSRLMKNIREKRGYTYGIHSYIQNNKKECAWIISTETGKEYVDLVVEEIFKEFTRLKNTLVSEEELLQVKNFYLGVILSSIDNVFSSIDIWKNLILIDRDKSYFDERISLIKNISSNELRELSNKYLDKNSFIKLIVN